MGFFSPIFFLCIFHLFHLSYPVLFFPSNALVDIFSLICRSHLFCNLSRSSYLHFLIFVCLYICININAGINIRLGGGQGIREKKTILKETFFFFCTGKNGPWALVCRLTSVLWA